MHKSFCQNAKTVYLPERMGHPYIMPPIPPMPGAPPGIGASGSGLSVTSVSVVSTIAAMDAAFWSAERVTFAGSTMPRVR